MRVVARFGSRKSPLQSYVFFSLVAHAAFVAAMVIAPSFRSKPAIPHDAFMVKLVAPAPVSRAPARAEPQPVAPRPVKPQPKPEAASATAVVPETPKPLPEKIEPSPKKTEPTHVPSPPPRTVQTQQPLPGEAGGSTAPPGSGPQGDVAVAMEGDIEFAWYHGSVKAALYSHWRKPILEGIREPREVLVTFEIMRDGSIRDLRVESASGVRSLDRSALRAVSDAAPLPALPRSWTQPSLAAAFTFQLYPE